MSERTDTDRLEWVLGKTIQNESGSFVNGSIIRIEFVIKCIISANSAGKPYIDIKRNIDAAMDAEERG